MQNATPTQTADRLPSTVYRQPSRLNGPLSKQGIEGENILAIVAAQLLQKMTLLWMLAQIARSIFADLNKAASGLQWRDILHIPYVPFPLCKCIKKLPTALFRVTIFFYTKYFFSNCKFSCFHNL